MICSFSSFELSSLRRKNDPVNNSKYPMMLMTISELQHFAKCRCVLFEDNCVMDVFVSGENFVLFMLNVCMCFFISVRFVSDIQ